MPQTGKRRATKPARQPSRKTASKSSSSSSSPGEAPWEAEVPVKPARPRATGPDVKSRRRGRGETQALDNPESSPQAEDFRDVSVKSDYQGAVARAILLATGHLSSHSRLPVAPRRVVNFLKGNQFPRPQEREGAWAECFGLLQSHERAWLEEALESLVERGFLELEAGSAGRQGGVRLSPEGKRALRGLVAIPGGILPERPILGAHPEAEERLRLARQEMAWSEGRAAFGIFPNSVLAQLASRRPRTLSDLSEIPGLGEARIRKYGRKILAALGEEE